MYDGDTIRKVVIDMGFGHSWKIKSIRFFGIDTPELKNKHRPMGIEARNFVIDRIAENNWDIVVKSHRYKTGVYGRHLFELFVQGINLNKELVEVGLADINFYGSL